MFRGFIQVPFQLRASTRLFASKVPANGLFLRNPLPEDGLKMHSLADRVGLDLNSRYCYLLGASHHANTSIVARQQDDEKDIVGMVMGHLVPSKPDTYFVWQVGSDERARGTGIASVMIANLLSQHSSQVRYLEATVTPTNVASRALFQKMGDKLQCNVEVIPNFYPAMSEPFHEEEDLYRIGPFTSDAARNYLGELDQLGSEPERPDYKFMVRDLADVEALGNYKKGGRGKWESRRYLTRSDGFGFSFHHTVMYKNNPSFQWYKNHVESVYITQGTGTIEIVTEGTPEDFKRFIGTGTLYHLKPGVMYALRGEKHILTATSDEGLHCQCVFNPPVAGTEDHDERGVYPAVDDEGTKHYEYGPGQVSNLFKPADAYVHGSEWCE
jgi:L-2,4-diaminobutyric acid acetyltransferase